MGEVTGAGRESPEAAGAQGEGLELGQGCRALGTAWSQGSIPGAAPEGSRQQSSGRKALEGGPCRSPGDDEAGHEALHKGLLA